MKNEVLGMVLKDNLWGSLSVHFPCFGKTAAFNATELVFLRTYGQKVSDRLHSAQQVVSITPSSGRNWSENNKGWEKKAVAFPTRDRMNSSSIFSHLTLW